MHRTAIAIEALAIRPHHLLSKQWMLLTAGDFAAGRYNAMTIAWGGFGTLWNRPLAMVVVRPTRFTYEFMEQYPDFTLCAFPEAYRGKLQFVGSRSGRDGDKIRDSGLTPIASQVVAAPSFDEAELVLECRKLYWQDLDPLHFLDPQVESLYPQKDYHRMYCGEIAQALAAS